MSCVCPLCPTIPGYVCVSQSWGPEGHWCIFVNVNDPEDEIDQYCGGGTP